MLCEHRVSNDDVMEEACQMKVVVLPPPLRGHSCYKLSNVLVVSVMESLKCLCASSSSSP